MKKYLLFSFLCTLLFLVVPSSTLANNTTSIIQGNASSTVDVETATDGNGTSTTHVETTVNGNDQVYDNNQNGSVHIENTGNSYTVTSSPTSTLPITPSGIVTATPSGNSHHFTHYQKYTHESFWERIKNLFTRIFHFF